MCVYITLHCSDLILPLTHWSGFFRCTRCGESLPLGWFLLRPAIIGEWECSKVFLYFFLSVFVRIEFCICWDWVLYLCGCNCSLHWFLLCRAIIKSEKNWSKSLNSKDLKPAQNHESGEYQWENHFIQWAHSICSLKILQYRLSAFLAILPDENDVRCVRHWWGLVFGVLVMSAVFHMHSTSWEIQCLTLSYIVLHCKTL